MADYETFFGDVNNRINSLKDDPERKLFIVLDKIVRPTFEVVLGSKMWNGGEPMAQEIPEYDPPKLIGRLPLDSLAYDETVPVVCAVVEADDSRKYGFAMAPNLTRYILEGILEQPEQYAEIYDLTR